MYRKNVVHKLAAYSLVQPLTSFITGITEPIEFMFLFVAPWLYVFHAFLDGVSFLLRLFKYLYRKYFLWWFLLISCSSVFYKVMKIPIGCVSFSWEFLGLCSIISLSFSCIRIFNVMTPGRGEETEENVEQETSSLTENAHKILQH